jgi:hypothetical protein
MDKSIDRLRVGVLMSNFQMPIDPLKNTTITNAFFVNHLYANLISVNDQNEYEADLAEKFYWQDQTLVIEFQENSATNAYDAEFSLKRSFVSDINDHGDLWKVICNENESNESCLDRITVENNTLKINVANRKNILMVVPILATINYKIVPKSAFDTEDLKSSKIIDYSKTSGKFYIKNNNYNELYPNIAQFKDSDNIIKNVQIVDATPDSVSSLIKNDEIDVVSTTVNLFEEHLDMLNKLNWSIDKTHNIKITFLTFSNSAIAKTKTGERLLIGNEVSNVMKKSTPLFAQSTNQFFQNFGQGYLTEEQVHAINIQEVSKILSTELSLSTRTVEKWAETLKHINNLKIINIIKKPFTVDESSRPDVIPLTNDVSFETSFSQISYLSKLNIFKSATKSADQIINEYLAKPTNAEKIEYINQLHYEVISNCYIYPIWSSPYVTAVAPGFSSHMSKYSSRTLVWKIKKN